MKTVVLCSGGMDSVTALYWACTHHHVVAVLSFSYGSKHNAQEIPCAAFHAKGFGLPHHIVPLDFVRDHFASALLKTGPAIPHGHYEDASMKQTVVPFRNGIMLALSCGFAESKGAEGVIIGAHAGDHAIYPDCREDFMLAMADAMEMGTYAQVQLLRPFINVNKGAIVVEGTKLGVDYRYTHTCYSPVIRGEPLVGQDERALHCGLCGACQERKEAFAQAGLPDPVEYAQ